MPDAASAGAGAGVRPADDDVRFEGPLHELVAIGLHRPTLDALCAGAPKLEPPRLDRGYLLKILDEEVGRQFSQPFRPIVEIVLNAVDASHAMPAPIVDVDLSPGHVHVEDWGEGMGLRAILSKLLVPFATDKRPGAQIGRFGVGFFSVMAFGLAQPESFSLSVETGDGAEGWAIVVNCASRGAAGLTCAVHRREPMQGTCVAVRSSLIDPEPVRGFLRESLHFLPPERALVRVDGAPLNDGSLLSGGRLFEDTADPLPFVARFRLGGRALVPGISAATYHEGVRVESCLVIPELCLIDFPGCVEVTEGRDSLKVGPEYAAVAAAFYRRLARLAESARADAPTRERLAELVAQVSALMLQSAAWDEVAPELARVLLGAERFLVGPERAEQIVGFLGPHVAPRIFVPESFWAERQWVGHLPGEAELLDRELESDPLESLASLARRRPDLDGLAVLSERAPSPETVGVALVRPRSGATAQPALPCLGTRRAVLVREDASPVRRAPSWIDLYALRAAFDRACGLRESDVERDIIVNDPARSGGHA